MNRTQNSKLYIIIATLVLCVTAALIIRYLLGDKEIQAHVSTTEVYANETVKFSDSTYKAKTWLWEFGNGDFSESQRGEYVYRYPGTYQIRLTVDKDMKKEFHIRVKEPIELTVNPRVEIDAPRVVLEGENVIFRGIGSSKDWRWSFGETGIIDSRNQTAIYSYSIPGNYDVELMTEHTEYPIRHVITVKRIDRGGDTGKDDGGKGNDIKFKLQAIVDGKPFNENYNYVMNKYLCSNPNALVTVNQEKFNDFYSYCQGLRILGRGSTTIVEVEIVPNDRNPNCIDKLFVTQFTNN